MNENLFVTKVLEPLSQEEILMNFKKFHDGDIKAREKIINHNIGLVFLVIRRIDKNSIYDKKELFANDCLGLIKAVDTFDTSKGYLFSSYACTCIKNEVMLFIRKESKHINDCSLDEKIGDDNNQTLGETILDDKIHFEDDYEKVQIYKIVKQCVNELPHTERRVVLLYYGFIDNKLYNQEEIGKILNCSKQYVSNTLKKAKNIVSLSLQEKGIIEKLSYKKRMDN